MFCNRLRVAIPEVLLDRLSEIMKSYKQFPVKLSTSKISLQFGKYIIISEIYLQTGKRKKYFLNIYWKVNVYCGLWGEAYMNFWI